MIQINAEDKTKHVAQLPHETFIEILNQVLTTIDDDELVSDALSGRICDLEDTIEIKYIK